MTPKMDLGPFAPLVTQIKLETIPVHILTNMAVVISYKRIIHLGIGHVALEYLGDNDDLNKRHESGHLLKNFPSH